MNAEKREGHTAGPHSSSEILPQSTLDRLFTTSRQMYPSFSSTQPCRAKSKVVPLLEHIETELVSEEDKWLSHGKYFNHSAFMFAFV
jgi:hypothetical protein